jgi:pyruvate kinase
MQDQHMTRSPHLDRRRTRRTKIVATIGPASWHADTIAEMVDAGMNMARLPLAHGSIEDAVRVLRTIRSAAPEIGLLADLPGPKIRAASFPEGGAAVVAGSPVELVTEDAAHPSSSSSRIAVAHEELIANLQPGDKVALGDGGVALTIESRVGDRVIARVRSGGLLQGRPGVTAPASRSALSTPTEDDLEKLAVLVAEGVDVVAVSFVNRAADMEIVRSAAGPGPLLCAKIETPEGVAALDSILAVTESVMVARGDLGVRIPIEDVPHVQKEVIRAGIRYGRAVITATQMLESMISSPVPTRAEATDVANAVFDGTSAVMLSGETAIGVNPVEAVATMAAIARRAEDAFDYRSWGAGLDAQEVAGHESEQVTATITAAAWRASMEQGSPAIIACTRSGATARSIARFRPAAQVIAATPLEMTARQLKMSWGVESVIVKESYSTDEIVWFAVQEAVEQGFAKEGDVVVVLAGSPDEPEPVTDTLRLVRVH